MEWTQTQTMERQTYPLTATIATTVTMAPTVLQRASGTGRLGPINTPMQSSAGAQVPLTAAMGQDLETYHQIPQLLHPLTRAGLAPTTIHGHRKILRWLMEVPVHLRNAPLATAILGMVNLARQNRKWMWSTTTTKMATIQGALANLPLYGSIKGSSLPILLRHEPAWRLALKGAARKAREQAGRQPKPVSEQQIRTILSNGTIHTEIRAAILLAWITAARVGDTLQLRKMDVDITDITNSNVKVTWSRGKTVSIRGPYTVSAQLPQQHKHLLIQTWQHITNQQLIFSQVTGKQVKLALRTVDMQLEQRSIRRGALQCLAAAGTSLETLQMFSGHTTTRMLLRYLGYGRFATAQNQTMLNTSRVMAL